MNDHQFEVWVFHDQFEHSIEGWIIEPLVVSAAPVSNGDITLHFMQTL